MFTKVPTDMNFVAREEEIVKFWREHDIFRKSIDHREGGDTFTFYDGPPTANGKPHIGHIETRAIKDLIPRYQTMKGKHVLRKAGWDTHGLPVELEVEKILNLDGKPAIEKYGLEPFIKKCRESVWKYQGMWEEMSDRVGFWCDMENPYITYEDDYIESEWWSLKEIDKKELLYKAHRVVPYCPRCGTALSSHEVSQGYKTVKERSAVVRFKVKGEENTYLYAWTTTPWTLPSNVALCVNANETYARFDFEGRTIIMGDALIEKILGEGAEVENKTTFPGSELVGMRYEPLFDFQIEALRKAVEDQRNAPRAPKDIPGVENAWVVIADDYVTMSDGTGIVHIAPAFGEDDDRVSKKNGVPFMQLVNLSGELTEDTPWAGVFVKNADPMIIEYLDKEGKLVSAPAFEHDYPFCWRCDTPLIYYARDSWFIRMTALHDELMANNQTVNWMPDNIKDGRFGNFLDNVNDWALSRERYWGTPLPVWVCDCGHLHVVGSRQELIELGENVDPKIELHRPYIDEVVIPCPKCGGKMHRTPEVIDCWYDSGSMPFAQWHYPFENKETFEQRFPADFISEAIDQTRGWFYSLIAISTLLFNQSPYKNCLVMGHVQDAEGRKMSKHIGNVVDPWDVLNKQGADAVRWYFYASGAPWLPTRFSGELVSELQSKFMGTLWNTYAFFAMYASIDDYKPAEMKADPADFSLMDKWVLSKLHSLVKFVDEGLAEYKIFETSRAIQSFVDELSNWYVRRCRKRFWGKGMEGDKLAAFETLYTVLTTLCGLCAPYVPFMSESMYQNLVVGNVPGAPESVHLTDFPVCNEALIDKQLEADMEEVIAAVQLGRAARNEANCKVRQPAPALYVKGAALSAEASELIEEELNVKKVVFVEDASAFTAYKLKPQMRTLGPKYGKLLGKIGQWLANCDGNACMGAFEKGETVKFEIDGIEVELAKDDVLASTSQKAGFVTQSDRDLTVVLDTNLTEELIEEGFAREVISKLQTMRKEADFEVTDRISVYYQTGDKLASIIAKNGEEIMNAVLAVELEKCDAMPEDAVAKDWNINGEKAVLGIKR